MRAPVDVAMTPERRERHALTRRDAVVRHQIADPLREGNHRRRPEDPPGPQPVEPVGLRQAVGRQHVRPRVHARLGTAAEEAFQVHLVHQQIRLHAGEQRRHRAQRGHRNPRARRVVQVGDDRKSRLRRHERREAIEIDRVAVLEAAIEPPHAVAERPRDFQQRFVRRPLDDHFRAAAAAVQRREARQPVGVAGAARHRKHPIERRAVARRDRLAQRRIAVLHRQCRDEIRRVQPKQRRRAEIDPAAREVDVHARQRFRPVDVRKLGELHGRVGSGGICAAAYRSIIASRIAS